jgi:hypothetical protein
MIREITAGRPRADDGDVDHVLFAFLSLQKQDCCCRAPLANGE